MMNTTEDSNNDLPAVPLTKSQLIQFQVGQLLLRGWVVVDTRSHTLEAVRMAYMREIRKVKDLLGMEQQRLETTQLEEDSLSYLIKVVEFNPKTASTGYKIVNPPKPPKPEGLHYDK